MSSERILGSWAPPAGMGAVEAATAKEREEEAQSPTCGGTAHLLPRERARASFDTLALTYVLDGGPKATMRRRWLWSEGAKFDNAGNYYLDREALVAQHVKRFQEIHRSYAENAFRPTAWDIVLMGNASRNQGAMTLHYGAFCPTLLSQMSQEQLMEWVIPAYKMDIVGCLVQTELGHGSNVRGLQTTATYDPDTQEFVLCTPTLRSLKWWPGGLGKTANFAALYAQLIVGGVERGLHVFLLQLRDERHVPMPGVEVGEIGPKLGDNHTETGFLRLTNVRIPRSWMMAKNAQVTPEGEYVKKVRKGGDKLTYTTMLQIRAGLVMGAGARLAQGVTIATRYSCVRQQGFKDTSSTSRLAEENCVLDYQVQQYRIFKQLGVAYALTFTGKSMADRMTELLHAVNADGDAEPDLSDLPEMHATSSGLKALGTFSAAEGLEECRKCCGGHGVMLVSGVAQHALDYTTYCTAEGDRIILELQSARFLIKSLRGVAAGEKPAGACDYLEALMDASFNPTTARCTATTAAEFTDHAVLLDVFRHRALTAVVDAGARLKKLTDGGDSHDVAWNKCAVDLVQASRMHCYYVLLRGFVSEVRAVEDAAVRAALGKLCSLFALQNTLENIDYLVGYFSAAAVRGIKEATRAMLAAVRPDAVALTDAFEFPDNVLNSAIGRYDGKVYEALYAAARSSPMNARGLDVPFDGYKHMEKYLDKDFIKEHAAMQRAGPPPPASAGMPRSRL